MLEGVGVAVGNMEASNADVSKSGESSTRASSFGFGVDSNKGWESCDVINSGGLGGGLLGPAVPGGRLPPAEVVPSITGEGA